MDCYSFYEDQAVNNEKINLAETFKFNKTIYESAGPAFMGQIGPWKDGGDADFLKDKDKLTTDPDLFYLAKHMQEAELYQFLEDDFDCSGMCRPSLFYFGNPISSGQPEETCLLHFKHALGS